MDRTRRRRLRKIFRHRIWWKSLDCWGRDWVLPFCGHY